MNKQISNNKKLIYTTAFLIPMALYMLIGVILRLYPISDNTILYSDMENQFISFYTAFKHIFEERNNLIYTFSKNLGGDMVGFSAYYLQNPFLLILFLFPDEKLSVGIYLMEILMLSTAGLTFQIFITRVFGRSNLIFSTAYAMMGYVTAYFMLPIYFCNIILLPIVIMGLYMMLGMTENETGALIYALSLALSIFTNYYLGYMLCIFVTLYFAFLCASRVINYSCDTSGLKAGESNAVSRNTTNGTLNDAMDADDENTDKIPRNRALGGGEFLNMLARFVTYSVIGVMISCVDLIPVVLSLRDQKAAPNTEVFRLHRMFRLADFYKSFMPASFSGDISAGAFPHLYIGIIPLIFVIFYFFNRRIQIRRRISALCFIGVMVLCLYIDPLNTIWHAFNEPVGFSHRFAFYLSFLLLVIGYMGYPGDIRKYAFAALLILTVIDLTYNTVSTLTIYTDNCSTQSEYESNYYRIKAVTEGFKALEPDDGLYRAEKDFQYTMEDPMLFSYAGLSHNSSCEKDYAKRFLGRLGLRYQGIWSFYNQGATAFTDSFFGVKYFTSRFDTTEKPYERVIINEAGDVSYTFRNPYALPFGFMVDSDRTEHVDMDTDNLFAIQNDIAQCFDYDEEIFEEADITDIRLAGDIKLSESAEHNDVSKTYVSDAASADSPAYIEFDINVCDAGKIMYFYFAAPHMQGARIYVNGVDWDNYFSDWRWAIEKVGIFNPGDTVTIRIEATGDELTIDDYYIYYEDPEALARWYERACTFGTDTVKLTKLSSSHITGTFNAAQDGLFMMTIPYEKGWHITIDGERVAQRMVLNALTGIDVSAGEHTIEMTYVPEGLIIGIIVSVMGIVALCYVLRGNNSLKLTPVSGKIKMLC